MELIQVRQNWLKLLKEQHYIQRFVQLCCLSGWILNFTLLHYFFKIVSDVSVNGFSQKFWYVLITDVR